MPFAPWMTPRRKTVLGRRFRRGSCVLLVALFASAASGEGLDRRSDLVAVDIGEAPWSAVGRINNSAYGRCSATLVRPDVALTAAHCLYNIASRRFLQPASIHILFGYSKGKYGFHTTASKLTIPDAYVPGGVGASATSDWAIVRLATPAPAGFAPMTIATPGDTPPAGVRAAGFGQERSEVLTATAPCDVVSAPADALLVTDCHLTHGYSGGPMIDVATGALVGVSIAVAMRGGRTFGLAVPIASVSGALPQDGTAGSAPVERGTVGGATAQP